MQLRGLCLRCATLSEPVIHEKKNAMGINHVGLVRGLPDLVVEVNSQEKKYSIALVTAAIVLPYTCSQVI